MTENLVDLTENLNNLAIYPPIEASAGDALPTYDEVVSLKSQSSEAAPLAPSTVSLNIGGVVFQTTKSTLTKFDGFFKSMIESELSTSLNLSAPIFIDRDPNNFRLILNFMRDGDVALPDTEKELIEICYEAQYYLLDGLIEKCAQKLRLQTPEVKLNIGGVHFEITKSTLTNCDGIFKTLVKTIPQNVQNESSSIFIDRSAKHFELILNFMRDQHVDLPESMKEVLEIQREAQYYFLQRLDQLCSAKIVALEK
ncbi:unnamed protein product [Caenorhabditis brenneri]